ncbi:MAG: hypothetical protein ABL984_14455 [Pyrinomonadaceae bacterium]
MIRQPLVFFSIVCIALGALNHAAQTPSRIKFARGAVSANVTGKLNGYTDAKTYAIKVRAGQTLRTQQTGKNNITISIKDPNGEDVSDADASCNNRKEITPTIAGDYVLTVVQCQKADEWNSSFRFRVTVN